MIYATRWSVNHAVELTLDNFSQNCQGSNSHVHRRSLKKIDLRRLSGSVNQMLIRKGDENAIKRDLPPYREGID